MSKRTKSKLRDFRIFLSKEVFNGRYIIRNILVTTIVAAIVATGIGLAVLTGEDVVAEAQVEHSEPQNYTINSIDTEVIRVDSINYLLADLDAASQAGVEANETVVVSEPNKVLGKVNDNDVYIRAEASYVGAVISTAYMDEEYTIDQTKSNEEWICIVLEDGTVGYINSLFVTIEDQKTEEVEAVITLTESSSTSKPAQESASAAKENQTVAGSGGIVSSTPSSTTESTVEPSTEQTTEAPSTEQATTDKPHREDTAVDGGVPVSVTYRNSITLSQEDINLMATIVTLESGGESYDGQLAVANVIINRMLSGHWGSTVSDVVYAPYQFSCVSSPKLDYYLTNGAQASCVQAVNEALSGVNNIGNYMCFRATYVTDLEDYSVYTVIGNHVFH